ncbi:WD40 repeat-like protein [Eremomyces bilateralis CBS 781.70]|uniref:WD40 repeat-like protein n=1 Tax=Eremomyces bilateralis CBS 781.70 TaxID=1392243 RepID=A0A6G1FWT2_9PEZI|nr:WD40 repeat-like protein [Eremomyces bilateralis CBS 781.70]KAF1810345.1 WD40 repeat-like protein [Eremomyces bilateralis CBS 781.70]
MVRKQRKRICYVLPLAKSAGGHRLGVNGLAVDPINSILYSGGRDGAICAWDLHVPLADDDFSNLASSPPPSHPASLPSQSSSPSALSPSPSTLRQQVQAHTHWINDIVLANQHQALVSASSDITVKLWRPFAADSGPPTTIGLHSDYVKCVACPSQTSSWVASGGLDRKICLWDLAGNGQTLSIDCTGDDSGKVGQGQATKGSVYALGVTPGLIASGGPESVVRVWDPRSGKRVTKFVGHTDNIRAILVARDGETILTASSDQTIKVWDVAAGRCGYTLTMHNDSVWSLFSDDPRLSVFYSSDRGGMVAKTDTRGCAEVNEGMCVAVAQEHDGVNKIVKAGKYIWTATSNSSINRWTDVDLTDVEIQPPDSYRMHRSSVVTTKSRQTVHPASTSPPPSSGVGQNMIPFKSVLRLSNVASFLLYPNRDMEASTLHSTASARKPSGALDALDSVVVPLRQLPDHSIEGQNGLIKHVMLNDRRRVLTLDTAGEVILWDLITCQAVKSFGKKAMDDVLHDINPVEAVAHWCAVDTRTGSLTCVLDENHCFDAEMYADEVELDEGIEFREDQRINLGKWVLRYLFADLINEEIRRDEEARQHILDQRDQNFQRGNTPGTIQIPQTKITTWNDAAAGPASVSTLRANNGMRFPASTPGLAIGIASPGGFATPGANPTTPGVPIPEAENELDKPNDYFSATTSIAQSPPAVSNGGKPPATPSEPTTDETSTPSEHEKDSANNPSKDAKESNLFSKKMRMPKMSMTFAGMKKLGRSASTAAADATSPANIAKGGAGGAPSSTDERSEDGDSHSSRVDGRAIEDNFLGTVQKIRSGYEEQLASLRTGPPARRTEEGSDQAITGADPGAGPGEGGAEHSGAVAASLPHAQEIHGTASGNAEALTSAITPSLPNDTPVLKPPLNTLILIQEDRGDSGGVADLFEGEVGNLGKQADTIEKVAPLWLAEVLLRNQMPLKDIVKVSFILEPYQNLLPSIASDGNNRLNANRMLRARKILAYVAERIEAPSSNPESSSAMKPEEYLDLFCQNQFIPPTMTLATIRAHVWRGGGDVVLYYRANGKKEIKIPKPPKPVTPEPPEIPIPAVFVR